MLSRHERFGVNRRARPPLMAALYGAILFVIVFVLILKLPAISLAFLADTRFYAAGSAASLLLISALLLIRTRGKYFAWSIICLYFALLFLGYWAYETLMLYKTLGYPIAVTQPMPSQQDVRRVLALDAIAGMVAAYAVFLFQKFSSGHMVDPPTVMLARPQQVDIKRTAKASRVLFVVGLTGAAILVASQGGRLALLSSDVDTVRYSQSSGVGFASLMEFSLLPAVIFSFASMLAARKISLPLTVIMLASLSLLLLTRAERTPLLLAALGCLIYAVRSGIGVKWRWIAIIGVPLAIGALALGVLRLESQNVQVTEQERQVRNLFDISPEVRERGYVYEYYGDQVPYLGPEAIPPIILSVLPGSVIGFAGIDKSEIYSDSSRTYSEEMRRLGIYTIEKPIRVGLTGELYMDGGPLMVLVGTFSYGLILARLSRLNSIETVFGAALTSSICCFALIALILPLATLAPIALAALFPLLFVRSSKR